MITYIKGDLLEDTLQIKEKTLICHVCNNLSIMGKGFASQLKEIHPDVFQGFKKARLNACPANYYKLTARNANLYVCNMVCMNGLYSKYSNPNPLSYPALKACLEDALKFAVNSELNICMPKIGVGLARGDWNKVVKILDEVFAEKNINIEVWDNQ
jgi:O-acetyl-ADP-ribose deacetylase (regulator of RNase III)